MAKIRVVAGHTNLQLQNTEQSNRTTKIIPTSKDNLGNKKPSFKTIQKLHITILDKFPLNIKIWMKTRVEYKGRESHNYKIEASTLELNPKD